MDDPLFTINSAANIFPYLIQFPKTMTRYNCKIYSQWYSWFSLYDLRVLFQRLPFVKSFFQKLLFTGVFKNNCS